MGFIDEIKARAKACKKTIVLPETEDERTYKAAETVLKEGLADLVLVGSKRRLRRTKYIRHLRCNNRRSCNRCKNRRIYCKTC